MTKMVRIHAFGHSDVLRLDDVEMPPPGPGEMRVAVFAAGVNPVDYKIREGHFPPVSEEDLPYALGRDISGVVEEVGPGVTEFSPGAAVHAMLGQGRGGYAEEATVRVAEAAPKPEALDHAHAAAVPLAALTAWQGLFDHGRLGAGQTVLIHGGAGGVGHFAVQLAKAHGATVITTARREDSPFLSDLGADRVIDYQEERLEDAGLVDLVFDLIGGETQARSWTVLNDGGAMVSTLEEPSGERAREKGAHTARYLTEPTGAGLAAIDALIAEGRIRPVVVKAFALDEAAKAQDVLDQEHTRGKIVLAAR